LAELSLIVGLGNPGEKYRRTRHNLGFRVVDRFAERAGASAGRDRFSGELIQVDRATGRLWLLKPMTYMNDSGRSVGAALRFFKLPPEQVLIVHDELDLPFGQVRLKLGGGDAGHQGVRSVISHLGTDAFARARLGIGRPPAEFQGGAVAYVLEDFPLAERASVEELVGRAVEAVELTLDRGLSQGMNVINQRNTP
jgi:PTH1 family peptidyl-tRNA hydrolase